MIYINRDSRDVTIMSPKPFMITTMMIMFAR